MSSTDPEDPSDPVTRRAELPSDVDAAFAGIVADWSSTGAPAWPDTDPTAPPARDARHDPTADDGPSSGVGTATPPRGSSPIDPPRPEPDVPHPAAPRSGPHPDPDPDVPRPAAHRPYPTPPPDDENFVPPEPPPLPRVRFSAVLGLLLLVLGVVLLAVPGLVGASLGLGLVPGLLAMAAGLGWLVLGLRKTHDDDSDDGAVV